MNSSKNKWTLVSVYLAILLVFHPCSVNCSKISPSNKIYKSNLNYLQQQNQAKTHNSYRQLNRNQISGLATKTTSSNNINTINNNNHNNNSTKKLMDSSDLKLEYCNKCDIYLGGLFPVHAPKYVRNKPSTQIKLTTSLQTSTIPIENEFSGGEFLLSTTNLPPLPSTTPPISKVIDDIQSSLMTWNDINCGEIKKERGIQRLEAMLYAIDLINNMTDLLPNLRLGARIYDTCDRDTIALEKCIHFVSDYFVLNDENIINDFSCSNPNLNTRNSFMSNHALPQKNVDAIHKRKVIGVIGAASSSVSIQVANMLRLFQVNYLLFLDQ